MSNVVEFFTCFKLKFKWQKCISFGFQFLLEQNSPIKYFLNNKSKEELALKIYVFMCINI